VTMLAGLHDIESSKIAPPGTWLLDTVALSQNPAPKLYPTTLNIIGRLNHGYGSTGTLPVPEQYAAFALRCANYVKGSAGCSRWIIANEANLSREWPDGQPIFPHLYAVAYRQCRQAIHALPGHAHDEVLIAASGPWNNELKYPGNPNGDWIQYFADVINECQGELDGFALHAYTHGYDPALVTSTARMDAPFQNRYYNFRTYQDYCAAIPDNLCGLPVYITEADGNAPWQATGLMPAMLGEIDNWNKTGAPKIHCVIFYRFPKYDQFFIDGKDDVIAEYRGAVAKGYSSPVVGANSMPDSTFIPSISNGTPSPTLPPRQFDPLAKARGVTVDTPTLQPGQKFWFAKTIEWYDEKKSQGRHHIYGDVYKDGAKVAGVPLTVNWPSGASQIKTEDKSRDLPPFNYWYNYPMSPSINEFSIKVSDGIPSETVRGIGMGADGNSHIHTSTVVEWSLETMPAVDTGTPPAQPSTPATPSTPPSTGAGLLWPVMGPITQYFGPHGIDYPGSPGHDGLDFGVPQGTQVLAVADGKVMYVDNDPAGFGLYVRIYHPTYGFHSFMGHLSKQLVQAGQMVKRGEVVALTGSTGNSTGPHLHFSTRLGSETTYYDMHDGYHSGQANPLAVYALLNYRDPNGA
jgi:hypothetical protein